MRAPTGCPDRCGGKAERVEHSTDRGRTWWRCSRCGTEWATPGAPGRMDPAEGARLREAGTTLAALAEGEAWGAWARRMIVAMAVARPEGFTADDLVAAADAQGRQPLHRNAIGAAFRHAAQAGLIHWTGAMRPSDQRTAHQRLIRVWRARG